MSIDKLKFNHDADKIDEAVGVETEVFNEFIERHNKTMDLLRKVGDCHSKIIEVFYEMHTKEELALMLGQLITKDRNSPIDRLKDMLDSSSSARVEGGLALKIDADASPEEIAKQIQAFVSKEMKEMKEERESSDEDDEPSSKASRDLAEMLKRRLLGGS